MMDITINIISDDYEIRRVRVNGNAGSISQSQKYKESKKIIVQLPFDRDYLNINPCGNPNYSDNSDFINIRSNNMFLRKVVMQGKNYVLKSPKNLLYSEVLVATVDDNFRCAINVICDEYFMSNVKTQEYITSTNKSSKYHYIKLSNESIGKEFTIILVDETLSIEKLENGFHIYSEAPYVFTKDCVKTAKDSGQINLPNYFENKEVIIFEAADIIY